MEPMTMLAIAGALSQGIGALRGGGDQEMRPYFGAQSPPRTLEDAMNALKGLGSSLEQRPAPSARSSYVQPGPAPVNVPGLGFQIGGGLGIDPANFDKSLLTGQAPPQGAGFTGMAARAGVGPGASQNPGAQLRPVPGNTSAPGAPLGSPQYRKPKDKF